MDENQFKLISTCEIAKEMWEILQVTYKCTKTIRLSKLQILATRFDKRMEEGETIYMFNNTKLCDISNKVHVLGEPYNHEKLVRKALRLPERFAIKVAAIEEARDVTTLKLNKLIGLLQTLI